MALPCLLYTSEKYLNDGIAEYAKRLGRYCKLNFIQVPDEKTPDKASDALNRQIKETEGNRLLSHIRDTDYVIALAIEGKMLDSVELSDLIARLGVQGKSSIALDVYKRQVQYLLRECLRNLIIYGDLLQLQPRRHYSFEEPGSQDRF